MLVEYRAAARHRRPARPGPLYAVCLTDRLADGLSLVYSFYAPHQPAARSAPTSSSTTSRRRAALGLPHVYLGYWVEGSKKMGYKAAYLPQERLGLHGWARVER